VQNKRLPQRFPVEPHRLDLLPDYSKAVSYQRIER
jgi:hypothetical protein